MEVSIKVSQKRQLMTWQAIGQLRSKRVEDFGHGNMTVFKRFVDIAVKSGIKAICLLPIHETPAAMASLFSRSSMNALSARLLDLTLIEEIKSDANLSAQLSKDISFATTLTREGKMNIPMVEVVTGQYLNAAYVRFLESGDTKRKDTFNSFCQDQAWWLDKYAYFKALEEYYGSVPVEQWDQKYADLESEKAKKFKFDHARQIKYYQYVQMQIHHQVEKAFQYAHEKGIKEIELLIGVGVLRQSAEGFLMRGVFDSTRQIGCFPEPENGYPLQLWEFLAEHSGGALTEYKAQCFENMRKLGVDRVGVDHACGALGGYTTFPVFDPANPSRVLDAKNPRDAATAEAGGAWDIMPGDEAKRLDHAISTIFAMMEKAPDMKLTFETVGDENRRKAAETAIQQAIAGGADITIMRALPWEETPLKDYGELDRLSLTHDMPALIGLLAGVAGGHRYPWIDGKFVQRMLNRLGVLAPNLDRPIQVSSLTTEFMLEMHNRITGGANAGSVVMPISSFFTLLSGHLDAGKWQCANIQPGTSGLVNNGTGNWEQRLPNIEDLQEVSDQIKALAAREPRLFNKPEELVPLTAKSLFLAQVAQVRNCSVAYQALSGKWTVWQIPEGIHPVLELAVTYTGSDEKIGYEGKVWEHFDVVDVGIEAEKNYVFQDLVGGTKQVKTGTELLEHGLYIGLNQKYNRHHFVIYEAVAA